MAVGDAANQAGYPLVPNTGSEDALVRHGAREINRTRDFIANVLAMIPAIWSIQKGGTGSSTIAGARTNLQVPSITAHNTKADKPSGLGNRAVMDVNSRNRIGMRWNDAYPVFRVDDEEFELAYRNEIVDLQRRVAALEAR